MEAFFRDVREQQAKELGSRQMHIDPLAVLMTLEPKRNGMAVVIRNAGLSQSRPVDIAGDVSGDQSR